MKGSKFCKKNYITNLKAWSNLCYRVKKLNMNKILLLLMVILITVNISNAQSGNSTSNSNTYKNAIGVKFYPGAISFKHFFNQQNALELLGYFRNYGTRITGLYEIHGDLANAGGLKWYIGPGAHVSLYSSKYGGGGSAGVDGVIGLDYKIRSAPVNLSLDWQPSYDFKSFDGFIGDWFGIGIRYTLN